METPFRMLVTHLLSSVSESRLAESESMIASLRSIGPLEEIVELEPSDASIIGSLHTTRSGTPRYRGISAGTHPDHLEANILAFTTINGLHSRLSQKGYPRTMAPRHRREAYPPLSAAVADYALRASAQLSTEPHARIRASTDSSGLVARIPCGTRSDAMAQAYLQPILDTGFEQGFSSVVFALPLASARILPDAYRTETLGERIVMVYRSEHEPQSVRIAEDVFAQLFEGIMGATSNRP